MMTTLYIKSLLAIAAIAAATCSFSAAEAHRISSRHRSWQPPKVQVDLSSGQIVEPFCDGKYESVAGEINRDSMLGHVNLYRLNSGLEPLQTQNFSTGFNHYGHHTRRSSRLRDATLLLDREQSHLSPAAEVDYLQTLDLNTHSGPSLDWWLNNTPPKIIEVHKWCPHNQYEEIIGTKKICKSRGSEIAKTNTAFDWLMTTHQMQRARTGWMGSGALPKDEINTIFDHIDKQAKIRPGTNIWMTQYAHHTLFERAIPADISQRATTAVANILSCQASPTEYAIIAKGDLGLTHGFLPKVLAEQRTRRDIHTLTYKAMSEGNGLDGVYHAQLRSMVDASNQKRWAAVLLFLSAPDLATALDIDQEMLRIETSLTAGFRGFFEGSRNIQPLYFSLPTEFIPEKYSGMKLAHALSEDKLELANSVVPDVYAKAQTALEVKIVTAKQKVERSKVYFSQSLILNKSRAKRYLQTAKQNLETSERALARLEKRHASFVANDIQTSDLPDRVKLTLIALLANASHNHQPHHRDLYAEQSQSVFLDVTLRRLLFPATAHNAYNRRPRSYYANPISRLMGEGRSDPAYTMPSLRQSDGTADVGLAASIDWDKIESFGDEKRLTRTLAINIFNWIDRASPKERAAHAHLFAPALYDIIRMGRHEDAGAYKGAPIQQRAFERLHKYYGTTDSAKTTPVWWKSRRRHGNMPQ